MSGLDLRTIARALGGEVQGRQVKAPGPGHSRVDRSMSVRLSSQSPTGWITHSYVGDPFDLCRDFVTAKLGLDPDVWRSRSRGQARPTPVFTVPGPEPDAAARIARARALWGEATDARDTVVEAYLAGRGLDLVNNINEVVRFHPRCPWRDEAEGRTIYVPAMVALMRSVTTNEPQAIHRTRLTPDGAKVDRRMLGIAAGAAVKLDADDEVTMGLAIGEGTETCLAARALGFKPCWAVASAGAVERFPVLGGIECLTILAENDDTNARAVEACAARWHAAGAEVHIIRSTRGSDLNDVLKQEVV